jgi:hypothetical protein
MSPCAYQEILELDEELIAFERSLPSVYMLPIDSAGRGTMSDYSSPGSLLGNHSRSS